MDRSVLSISNNTMSPNCLKLVKAPDGDRDVRIISSRMGMTVPDFMSVLGYSSSTDQNNCNSGGLVWPKHTELEVRDPWSAVYRYEPTDISWCIRFKGLGCYNFVPPPFADRSSKIPTTPQPVSDIKEVITNDLTSPNSAGFQTLLKMRPTMEKPSDLPIETITPAERHKLWEDLLLSDSEEESDERKRPPTSLGNTMFEAPTVDEELSEKAGNPCTASKLALLNHALRPPPPFVSPLLIPNDYGSGTESAVPSPHNEQIPCPQISKASKQEILNTALCPRDNADTHSEFEMKSSLMSRLSPSAAEKFSAENAPSKRLSETLATAEDLLTSAHAGNADFITDIPKKLSTVISSTTNKILSTTMPKTVPMLNDMSISKHEPVIKPCSDLVIPVGKEFYDQHCKDPEVKSSFIQRLLLESEEFLSQKDCLITELSPIQSKFHHSFVDSPKILSHLDSTKSAFIGQKLDKTLDPSNANGTSLNDIELTISPHKPVHQGHTGMNIQNMTSGESKIQDQQSSLHTSRPNNNGETDDFIDNKPSKLDSTSISQGAPKPSPIKSGSRISNISKSFDEEILRNVDLNLELLKHVQEPEEKIANSDANEGNELKTSVSDVLTSSTNMDKWNDSGNRFNNMPPPTHDSSGKKLKKRSRFSAKPTESSESVSVLTSEVPSFIPGRLQDNDDAKEDTNESVALVQDNQDITDIYPLRDIPSDCWVFSDLTVTKVRNKLQQSFPRLSGSSGSKDETANDLTSSEHSLIEKMRDILRSAVESDSPVISKATNNRRNRPRSLTGILLVPPSSLSSTCEAKLAPHPLSMPSSHRSYHDINTMTSPYLHNTALLNDADVQCDIWPSSNNNSNNLLCSRFASQCSNGIVNTPTQKPLGTVPPILRDPTSDLNTLSSNVTQNLPQLSSQSVSGINIFDSLCFVEEQLGKIIKQEDEKLQNSNASTEIFKAEEYKFEASRCWKALVSAISSSSRGSSSEAPNRSQMLLTLQALHEYPVQMTKSVRHYLAAAYIFESKNEILRAVGLLTEAGDQIQHCVRRMHRVEAKLTKRRNHRNETENSSDVNELVTKGRNDASWMYLWYYVLMRIKAIVGFHIYRLQLQSIESLREEIDSKLSVIQQHIPSLNEVISLPKTLNSPSSSSSKVLTDKPKIPSNPSSEDDLKKMLESLVSQFIRLNQLTACVRSAMMEWQQADELITKVPHLKSPHIIIPPIGGRKPDTSIDNISSSGHLRLIHSIDVDIASASDGAYITSSQIPILVLLRYMDGIFHVHPLIIDQLKYSSGSDTTQSVFSGKSNSNELRSPITVSQEQKVVSSTFSMTNETVASTNTNFTTVTNISNKQESSRPKSITNTKSTFLNTETNNTKFQSEPRLSVKERLSKKKSHKKHTYVAPSPPSSIASSVTKESPSHHPNTLEENYSDTSVLSSKHEIPDTSKQKSKRRRLLQLDESLPTDAFPNNSDTDVDSCGRPFPVIKCNESPKKKRHKSKLETNNNNKLQECFNHPKKFDRSDNSSSQDRKPRTDKQLSSKKKSYKRSHTHTEHPSLQGSEGSHSRNRIIASDDRSPNASPPPSRKFCRSKITNIHDINYPIAPDDNTYQPKRVKPSDTKIDCGRISNSESSESGSSPMPTYRPSVPVDSPNTDYERNQHRRSRSVHLSSLKQKNTSLLMTSESPHDELSHDSTGYSPTKGNFLDGNSSSITDTNNLPVYHVSHIPSSSPTKSPCNNRSVNSVVRSKSSHRSEFRTQPSSAVPSFYSRWIKEPSNPDRFPGASINNISNRKHSHW
ncbi:unnamed protein product [Heterobilharzia americana]|nr:unnamed protein product [Heterobilharzia americana]